MYCRFIFTVLNSLRPIVCWTSLLVSFPIFPLLFDFIVVFDSFYFLYFCLLILYFALAFSLTHAFSLFIFRSCCCCCCWNQVHLITVLLLLKCDLLVPGCVLFSREFCCYGPDRSSNFVALYKEADRKHSKIQNPPSVFRYWIKAKQILGRNAIKNYRILECRK